MPGGYGTSGPWGEAGTTSTPGPYSSPGGGNQGGPRHPGGYNPNLNPPVTVDYTSPVVDTRGDGNGQGDGTGVNTIDQVTTQEVIPPTQAELQVIQDSKVWEMAKLEASSDRYAKSWEGSEMIRKGKESGFTEEQVRSSKTWINKFGMPSIVSMPTYPQPGGEWEGIRSSTTGDYIYTGLGQALLDEGVTSEGYEQAKDKYWTETRPKEDPLAGRGDNNYSYGYSYGPGSDTVSGGYGYGYGGDPNDIGKTPFDYGDPYSEARYAPLEQHERMVDVNTPRYAARGGIMNLRR
jgi:hypothetical protein